MQKRLSEIKERLERATPGPWFVAEQPFDDRSTAVYGDNKAQVSIDPHGARFIADCDVTMEWTEGEPDQSVFDRANARFIANAPTDIAHLLATVEKLKASLEYCLDSMCKHDGEMRPGIGRKWCYQCSTWVCGSDLEQIVKARQALREI